VEEAKWVLKNNFESSEFRNLSFHLGWVYLPKKKKGKTDFQNMVKLKPLDKKQCQGDRHFYKLMAQMVDAAHQKVSNSRRTCSMNEVEEYRLKRSDNRTQPVEALTKKIKKEVDQCLNYFYKNEAKLKIEKEKLQKKGNVIYFKLICPTQVHHFCQLKGIMFREK
jgi:hypothetical protein